MNGLTRSQALVNSPGLALFQAQRIRNSIPSSVRLSFLKNPAGRLSTKTRTFTLSRSQNPTDNLRRRYRTAMDSDSHTHAPETEEAATAATATTATTATVDGNYSNLEEDRSVVMVDYAVEEEDGGVANDEDVVGEHRRELPEELSRSVVRLSCESSAGGGNCDVYLVGTAHVSMESCQEVAAVVSFLKPQVVFLELCANRVAVLTPQNLKVPTMGEMVDMWKKNHNMFGILYSWFLAKVASKLEVFPGTEFRVAYEEAMKYGGKVILGDRPVNITLRRTWLKMPLWHKTKLIYSLMFQAMFLPSPERINEMLKEMDDVDMLTLVIQEMSKEYPTLMETLVHERDQYMSSKLLKIASEHNTVVAVVGKGHLQGIKNHWKQPVAVKDLLELPAAKSSISVTKILSTVGVAVAGVAIVSGIYLSSRK